MYTKEMTTQLIQDYLRMTSEVSSSALSSGVIKELALKYGKSDKSIVGKLAVEKVYKKKVYLSKVGLIPETKKEIIAKLSNALGIDPEKLQGLEKAPKNELMLVLGAIVRNPA